MWYGQQITSGLAYHIQIWAFGRWLACLNSSIIFIWVWIPLPSVNLSLERSLLSSINYRTPLQSDTVKYQHTSVKDEQTINTCKEPINLLRLLYVVKRDDINKQQLLKEQINDYLNVPNNILEINRMYSDISKHFNILPTTQWNILIVQFWRPNFAQKLSSAK